MEFRRPGEVPETPQAGQFLSNQFFAKPVSSAMKELERIINGIAPTDIPVLVVGESGSGKEAIARQIHRLSSRSDAPFAKLVCATVTPQLAEKIFCFDDKLQIVQSLLNAGTIFLDEISDLDPVVQPRLLHVLPDGGPGMPGQRLRARIISSMARNPLEMIRQGRFREALYYRLNGVCLRVPALRERREDIPLLVEFFLVKYAALMSRSKPFLNARTMDTLVRYPWPGNVRQLEYTVKKLVALGDAKQAVLDLEGAGPGPGSRDGEVQRLSLKQAARAASQQAERKMILAALERTRWNRKWAARELRISYKALLYKLRQIGLGSSLQSSDGRGEHS